MLRGHDCLSLTLTTPTPRRCFLTHLAFTARRPTDKKRIRKEGEIIVGEASRAFQRSLAAREGLDRRDTNIIEAFVSCRNQTNNLSNSRSQRLGDFLASPIFLFFSLPFFPCLCLSKSFESKMISPGKRIIASTQTDAPMTDYLAMAASSSNVAPSPFETDLRSLSADAAKMAANV